MQSFSWWQMSPQPTSLTFSRRSSARIRQSWPKDTALCAFVNDILNARCLDVLANQDVRFVALRCAGFNQVDLRYASSLGIKVAHVPAYSPYAVAEFAMALVLVLNPSDSPGLQSRPRWQLLHRWALGFDLYEKTVGIVGTGKIGRVLSELFLGFGVNLLGCDLYHSPEFTGLGGRYVDLDGLFSESDIISLHCPLTHKRFTSSMRRAWPRCRRGS
jgi:D-lactate dehydrogenase